MNKKIIFYIALLFLFILSMLYLENAKSKPINWFPSYTAKHKIPYGSYILKEELKNLFPNTKIKTVTKAPYVFLNEEEQNGTYFFVNDYIDFGEDEILELMQFVENGNDVFISTKYIDIDTLNFETGQLISSNFDEKAIFKFKNKLFANREYTFDRRFENVVFSKVDTLNTSVLGITAYVDDFNNRTEEGVNFVKYNYGDGNFYFHTFPEAFTNFNILNDENHQHAANILSYIDENKPILWDAYYKTGKSRITSPMKYLLSSQNLKWAYYFALMGILIFIIFDGKRKQRYIPVILPLKNMTLAFTRTISSMYFEKSENKKISDHKINFLLEFVRLRLHIPTTKIDKTFYDYVSSRSGYPIGKVEKLFVYCERIQKRKYISEDELIRLNRMIENFKNTIQYGK